MDKMIVVGNDIFDEFIPNAEIAELFKDAVVARFERTLDTGDVDAFVTAMWKKDEQTASEMLTCR